MNFKELEIQTIRPLAILEGSLDGTRFIAEAVKEDGKTQFLLLTPPDYKPIGGTVVEQYILESAIAKHGYTPVEHNPITTFEDYEKYLREINPPLKQE